MSRTEGISLDEWFPSSKQAIAKDLLRRIRLLDHMNGEQNFPTIYASTGEQLHAVLKHMPEEDIYKIERELDREDTLANHIAS